MNRIITVPIIISIAGITIVFASPLFYDVEINESIPDPMMEYNMIEYMTPKSHHGTFVGTYDGITSG